ncbi:MAG: hypothetical protein K9N48_04355 [Verrucomicrobia bacterium]|nr:hypothetical protein [Verrucomicrobiota bacterium]MCF7709033.1 hypothetical protein [Verrucomicrobiota bacterium]
MKSEIHAAIDIGTNSVKFIIAELRNGNVSPLEEHNKQTRLGEGFYETQTLQPAAVQRTARCVAEFAQYSKHKWGITNIAIVATSAARDAINGMDLVNAVNAACEMDVRILSGDEEAELIFLSVCSHPALTGHPLLILDLGGGSVEFIAGKDKVMSARKSFNLGAIRLLQKFGVSDPPTEREYQECHRFIREFIKNEVKPELETHLQSHKPTHRVLVGTGGASTIMASIALGLNTFNRELIETRPVTVEDAHSISEMLWTKSLKDRESIPGLPANRADIMPVGALIHLVVLAEFGFSCIKVIPRGLRYGAILQAGGLKSMPGLEEKTVNHE